MSCKGLHCGGCGSGNKGTGLAGLAALVIGIAAVYRVLSSPAVHHAIDTGIAIAEWTLGTVAALAVLAAIAWATVAIRRALVSRALARANRARLIPAPYQEPATLRVVSVRVLPPQEPAGAQERERLSIVRPGRERGSAGR